VRTGGHGQAIDCTCIQKSRIPPVGGGRAESRIAGKRPLLGLWPAAPVSDDLPMPRSLLLLLSLFVLSCSSVRRDLEDVLDPTIPAGLSREALLEEGRIVQAELDLRALEARQAAMEEPEDVALLAAASRTLFLAADLRVQRAAHAQLARTTSPELEEVLTIEDDLSDAVRDEVEPLALAGIDFADRALELDPDHPDALLHRALHLSLLAWSRGRVRTILEGLGPTMNRAMKSAIATDPRHDGGAPLRLRGRFLARAPWPYRDREEAVKLLRRAIEIAPVPLNHLFLGDALYDSDDREGAGRAWREVLRTEPDTTTRPSIAFQRASARVRLHLLPGAEDPAR
jgi:tetratricopeptide (TPR) repeat protein